MDGTLVDPTVNVRERAARAVSAVMDGTSLDAALAAMDTVLSPTDRAWVRHVSYGVVRDYLSLSALAERLSERPQQAGSRLHSLLLVGLYQLRAMRVPVHAAVHATVAACAILGQDNARGFVNAVLRRYAREQAALDASIPGKPEVLWSYPAWLVAEIRRDWPRDWRDLLSAGNVPGPLTLRVNTRRLTRAHYLDRLMAVGIGAEPVAAVDSAVSLAQPMPVERLPGFFEGDVSVQDASAQLAAELLQAGAGMRVLDACAAPGGKTCHLLERHPDLDLIALDVDAQRLQRVEDNLSRLNLSARVVQGDVLDPRHWWDGRRFDRILLDAPCSGTGVIRRHPDIKWLRRPADLESLPAQQSRMLEALWPMLEPGGRLLFSTCSLLRSEGVAPVRQFLRAHADAVHLPIIHDVGEGEEVGRRVPPGGAFDGFYYGAIMKQAAVD